MENKQLHELLKEVASADLLYYIYSMRTDAVVVQWYSREDIVNISGCSMDEEEIQDYWHEIQGFLHSDWMMQQCGEHLNSMSEHAEDYGLEDLFED
jgi:hypothetical protein